MLRSTTGFLLTSLAAILALAPANAAARPGCESTEWRSAHRVYWEGAASAAPRTVTYRVRGGSIPYYEPVAGAEDPRYNRKRIRARILSGARTWSQARNVCDQPEYTPVQLHEGQDVDGSHLAGQEDGENVVDFGHDEVIANCTTQDIACTKVWHGNYITEADIRFDTDVRWYEGLAGEFSASKNDLWSLAAHEFGHFLGFAHVGGENASEAVRSQLMYPAFIKGRSRRYLRAGDFIGLCMKYSESVCR